MTYIIAEPCVSTCDTACVEVCPVDCIHGPEDKTGAGEEAKAEGFDPEGKQLYIDPEECIDCGACEPECPVDAIKADIEPGSEKWLEINKQYSEIWPNISEKKDPPSDHEKYKDEQNKFEKYFKENI